MQVWVISLPHSAERRTHIDKQFAQIDCDYAFFDAIDGHATLGDYFETHDEQAYLVNTGRHASPGEFGCFASHLTLWQRCVEQDEPIVVLEDDAYLESNFAQALETAEQLINEFGFIRLQQEWKQRKSLVARCGRFGLYHYPSFPLGAQAYALSPAAARALVSHSYVFDAPVDVFIKRYWEHRQPLFGLLPHAVSLSRYSLYTTITGRETPGRSLTLRARRFFSKGKQVARRTSFNLLQQVRQLRTS